MLYIENNVVEDYQKNGMALLGAGLTVNVIGNTVTGAGPVGYIAQNGIQLGNGAGGSILNNTVTGNYYTGADWTSSGILVQGAIAPLTICGNIIDGDQSGIYMYHTGTAMICDNVITNGDYGLIVWSSGAAGADDAEVTGNTFDGNSIVGAYLDNFEIPVHNNNFIGNADGLYYEDWAETGGILDATNNYWGCATGANTPGCDSASDSMSGYEAGQILLDPFLTEAYPPAPIPPAEIEPVIVATVELTAGGMQALSCDALNKIVLPSGDYVMFYSILCGFEAQLAQTEQSTLPGSVSIGSFASAMTLEMQQNGVEQKLLPVGSTARIAFEVPADSEETYAILYWNATLNDGQGGWVELSAGEVYEWSEGKEVYSGMHVYNNTNRVDNSVSIVVNFPGTFALVTK